MKLFEIKEILKAEILTEESQLNNEVFAGGSADLMDDILSAVAKDAVLLTGLANEQVIRMAKVAGVVAIVFVRGKKPDNEVIKLAKLFNLSILTSKYSMFVASGRLYMNGLRGLDGSW